MKKLLSGLVSIIFLISGCASTQKLSEADRTNLSLVKINTSVQKAPQMYYFGSGASVGMLFGAIGGAVTAATQISPAENFKNYAESNGVFIEKIVLEEARNTFKDSGKLTLINDDAPSASTMDIMIYIYGFSVQSGFSSKLVPVVGIKCSLADHTGKLIWRSQDSVTTLGNPAVGRTLDEFKSDPKLIDGSWRVAARAVLANIANNL